MIIVNSERLVGAHGVGTPAGPTALPRELAGGLAGATGLRAHGRGGPGGVPTPCARVRRELDMTLTYVPQCETTHAFL